MNDCPNTKGSFYISRNNVIVLYKCKNNHPMKYVVIRQVIIVISYFHMYIQFNAKVNTTLENEKCPS